MKNKILSFLQKENNITYTENDTSASKATYTHLIELFEIIGSLRFHDEKRIEELFEAAFNENPLLALKLAFYTRNIRGGLGERRTFRVILKYLAVKHPDIIRKNLDAIALFGRYDDFYTLIDTPVESAMWNYLQIQLTSDIVHCDLDKPISLLAKWLKSTNASSAQTNALGKLTAHHLGFSEKTYRKTLAELRAHLKVTESKMSTRSWKDIAYSDVPSRAMSTYHNAFMAHDAERFSDYLESMQASPSTFHGSTLFPYDLMEKMGLTASGQGFTLTQPDLSLESQWNSLPHYIDKHENVLVMADTSSSMCGRPLYYSIGMALYFAQHNTGAFKNIFMTFSHQPVLLELKGTSLTEQIACIPAIIENTNLEAAFNLILKVAAANHLKAREMPKSIIIITDMDLSHATGSLQCNWTFYDHIASQYTKYGYQIPGIIFWNVTSKHSAFQTASDLKGIQFVNGYAPAAFKSVLNHIGKTPYEAMLAALNDPVYNCLTL